MFRENSFHRGTGIDFRGRCVRMSERIKVKTSRTILQLPVPIKRKEKLSVVQVEGGGKTGGFPARHLFFQDVKKTGGGFRIAVL